MNQPTEEPEPADALAALERFVVENDELQQFEEAIGRFNIFDSLGIARVEIRHSNFLAWLLDPAESHGQGSLFLRTLLMDLLRKAPAHLRPISPIELDGGELRDVEILREWHNIDLLIVCRQPSLLVAIENKIDSGEHSNQLQRYEDAVAAHFQDFVAKRKVLFAFLTRQGDDPSDADWVTYSYADVYQILQRTRNSYADSIGHDVVTFVDHYLRLIGSRFMDNPRIVELCQKIYRNHRQALDLIYDLAGSPENKVAADIVDWLATQPKRWHLFNQTAKRVDFVPVSWLDWLPEFSSRSKLDRRMWLRWWVYVNKGKCTLRIEVGPCLDAKLRRRVIERLVQEPSEFGLKTAAKFRDTWTRLYVVEVLTWDEEEEPEINKLHTALNQRLEALDKQLQHVGKVLSPILAEVSTAIPDTSSHG